MKINCGPSPEMKAAARELGRAQLQMWHDFYAVWPRRVGDHDCRCLELIERKGRPYRSTAIIPEIGILDVERWAWEYRSKA